MPAFDPEQESSTNRADKLIVLGRVSGAFGVLGWIKLTSATDPAVGILNYNPWLLQRHTMHREYHHTEGRIHGDSLIARIQGCNNRDQALSLVGCEIVIRRSQLPKLAADDFYWSDLEGLRVQTQDGIYLGVVSHLFATGANDVLVVQGTKERLIPYVWEQVVTQVDLTRGLLVVKWDPAF